MSTTKAKPKHFTLKLRNSEHFYRMVALCDQQFGKGNWSARTTLEHRGRVVQLLKRNELYKHETEVWFVLADTIDPEKIKDVLAIAALF